MAELPSRKIGGKTYRFWKSYPKEEAEYWAKRIRAEDKKPVRLIKRKTRWGDYTYDIYIGNWRGGALK